MSGLVHGLGFGLILAPLGVVAPPDMNAAFHLVFPVLVLGAALAAFGGLFWLAKPGAWRHWLRGRARSLLALFGLAAVLPGLVVLLGLLWYQEVLTDITFIAVVVILSLVSDRVTADPSVHVIGADDFLVRVADSCSGIEGFVLITVFLSLLALLFHDALRLKWVVAVLISATLFAAMNGRWIEVGLAGLVFSLLYMRKGRLADAIAAHAIANAVIAGVALWRGDWSLI